MSKNTKIIVIVGGVLILAIVGYMVFTGGKTTDALGCGGKKNKPSRVKKLTAKQMVWESCRKYGFIAELDKDANVVMVPKDPKCKDTKKKRCKKTAKFAGESRDAAVCKCAYMKLKLCSDENFKKEKKNQNFCEKMAKFIKSKNCEKYQDGGGDGDADDEDGKRARPKGMAAKAMGADDDE
jgi:hypothetical protein